MDNYHYIIGGLPELTQDFANETFSYDKISADIRHNLSPKDNKKVDWLEFGFNNENLSHYFYYKISKVKSPFMTEYFKFDKTIRNVMVRTIAAKEHLDESKFAIGKINTNFEEYPVLMNILENDNIIDRELALDKFRWQKITEIINFHYFDMDVLLAFLAKGKIVSRWQSLDKEKGAELFEKLVQEVRGTFKGIDKNNENKN